MASAFLAGCGETTHPVEGVVHFRGDDMPATELAQGVVVFETLDQKEGARGIIGGDGRFRLETLDLREGALARKYRVAVVPPPEPGARTRRTVDSRFTKPTSSGIEVEVNRGTNNFKVVVDPVAIPIRKGAQSTSR